MTTAYRLKDGSDTHYGYGLRVHTLDGEPYLQSNGDIPGFHSEVVAMPRSHVFVAILHNGEDLPIGLDPIGKRLAAMAAGRPIQEPKAIPLPERALRALCGRYQSGGAVRTIGLENGRLFSQFPGDAPALLSPLSATECFFDENPDARLGFTLKDGQAIKVQRYDLDRAPGPSYTRVDTAPAP
jgi:serine beta-lactamase-like protein LACTB